MKRYQRLKAKVASEIGRRKAKARWALDRQRRATLARLDPIDSKPVRRIIDVTGETATEICIFSHDSIQAVRKKLRSIGLAPAKKVTFKVGIS